MKKTKAFYLVALIVFIFVGGLLVAKSVKAAVAPDGFVGIKWGSSKAEVAQLAKDRGYREELHVN